MGGLNRVYELILEIGHKSSPLTKKLANGYTHKWTVFVRGVNNSKIENCIQRVVFQLHESFENPYRDISKPPFQVRETGYAGFEIPIQIYFKNKDKPNHLVFVHDLVLLALEPNDNTTVEKIKFINPNREFEKCLIKSGAQLLTVPVKKERSDSPPAKKQKSSSLIPSKDMSKQPLPQSQMQPQTQTQPQQNHNHHNHHHNSSKPQNQNHHNSSNNQHTNHHNHKQHQHNQLKQQAHHHHHHHHQQPNQPQPQSQSQQQPTTKHKPKSSKSKEFIDIFGAPLAYNTQDSGRSNDIRTTTHETKSVESRLKHESKIANEIHVKRERSGSKEPHSRHESRNNDNHTKPDTKSNDSHTKESKSSRQSKHDSRKEQHDVQIKVEQQLVIDPLQVIQAKISCLTDCDRLQKIVDIIEEAGEWFNLTPKKFEFDLKRLDKKTLNRIERCLSH